MEDDALRQQANEVMAHLEANVPNNRSEDLIKAGWTRMLVSWTIWLTALLQAQRVLRKTLKKGTKFAKETANQPGLDKEDPDKKYKEELSEDENSEEKTSNKKGRGRGRGKGRGRGGRGKSKGKGAKQEQQQPDGEKGKAQANSSMPDAPATQLADKAAAVGFSEKKGLGKKAKAHSKQLNRQEQQPKPASTTPQAPKQKKTKRDDQEPKEARPKAKQGRKSGELPLDCPEAQHLI